MTQTVSQSTKTAPSQAATIALRIGQTITGVAMVAFIGYFIVYCIYAWALFQFPFDYDQGEGFELLDTILFSQGQWPYRNADVYPFYSSNYPPVYHLVIVPLVWLFGPAYWTGRLVSFVGTLINAAAIGYAVHHASRRRWLSVLMGLTFLASNYVYHVGPLFRQHMFMVMLETVAVVLIARAIEKEEDDGKPRSRMWLGVMALLLLAGYTKQLAYATVAAIFIFLFLRRPKRAVLWAVPFAAVTGLIFLFLNIATDGQWWSNTISANLNEFIPGQAVGLYKQWFSIHTIIIVFAGLFAVYQLYAERLSVYSVWFVVAAVNSVTAGTWGAGESYFATAIAAACILTGFVFHRGLNWIEMRREGGNRPVFLRAAAFAVIGLLMLNQADRMFHWPTHTPALRAVPELLNKPVETVVPPQTGCSETRPAVAVPYVDVVPGTLLGRPPTAEDTAAGQQIAALIAAGDTPAFSEEAGFNLYIDREVITNPTQLRNLYLAGALDLTNMLAALDEQQFDTVVLRAQFYPPEVLGVLGQRYGTTDLVEMNGFVYCIMQPLDAN